MKGKDPMAQVNISGTHFCMVYHWKSSYMCTACALLNVMTWFVKESCCIDLDGWVLADLFHASNISQTCNDPFHCI